MPPDRHLFDAVAGEQPTYESVQQLVEAESGMGSQGVLRTWRASDSGRVVLTSDAAGVKISRDNGTTAPTNILNDGTTAGGSMTGTYPNPSLAAATIDALIPPGTIWAYGGATAPAGWLLCDGVARATSAFPQLFAAIGYTYGGAAGVFSVPDLRGRVPLGASGTHALGIPGGSETAPAPTHTHPGSHSHGMNSHTHGMQDHTHTMPHAHNMNGHSHTTNIDHTHTASTGVLTGVVNRITPGTASNPNHPDDGHGHAVAVAHTGTTTHGSGQPSIADTLGPLTPSTGSPSNNVSQSATGSTTDTSPAYAADYGATTTIATLPPFQAVGFIIRTGA